MGIVLKNYYNFSIIKGKKKKKQKTKNKKQKEIVKVKPKHTQGPLNPFETRAHRNTEPPSELRKERNQTKQKKKKMAVPGRRNGMIEDDDDIEENGLFEEDGLVELDDETPPHLRDLAAATQLGDLEALRLALGPLITPLSISIILLLLPRLFYFVNLNS